MKVKERKENRDNPREGWEDGTPDAATRHRDFKERSVVLHVHVAVAHPRASIPLPISLRSFSPILAVKVKKERKNYDERESRAGVERAQT